MSQNPGTAAFTLNGAAVTGGVAVLDTQRRVLFTPGGSDSGVNYLIKGTDDSGQVIGETVAGVNSGSTVATLLDYKTVTSIKGSASVGNGMTVGTNGVGATPWFEMHWPHEGPFNVEAVGIVVAGTTVNWGYQYTYDNPWKPSAGAPAIPQALAHSTLNNQAGTLDGPINDPVFAVRLIVNSGTDAVRGVIMQSGSQAQ